VGKESDRRRRRGKRTAGFRRPDDGLAAARAVARQPRRRRAQRRADSDRKTRGAAALTGAAGRGGRDPNSSRGRRRPRLTQCDAADVPLSRQRNGAYGWSESRATSTIPNIGPNAIIARPGSSIAPAQPLHPIERALHKTRSPPYRARSGAERRCWASVRSVTLGGRKPRPPAVRGLPVVADRRGQQYVTRGVTARAVKDLFAGL